MEFRSEIGESGIFVERNTSRDSLNISVTSGPGSSDYVIDLQLAEDINVAGDGSAELQNRAVAKRVSLINKDDGSSDNLSRNSWLDVRRRLSGGKQINGWYYPVAAELSLEEADKESFAHIGSNQELIGEEARTLLNETLQVFNESADSFKENLIQLKNEFQTLPLFQGALKAINNTINEQKNEVNELKTVSDIGISSLIDGQKNIKSQIEKLASVLGEFQEVSCSKPDQIQAETMNEVFSTLKISSEAQLTSLAKIENQLKTIDISRFQSNLETIYKAVKRSIDDSRIGFTKIAQGLNSFASKPTIPEDALSVDDLVDLHEEVRMQLEAIIRVEKKIDKIKNKMFLGFAIGMVTLGLIFGSTIGMF